MNYKHTQIGWLILAAEALALAILAPMLVRADAMAWAALAVVLLVGAALLFGALTVEIGPDALHIRLGLGLVRARLPLAQVRSFRKVRDPWYFGWGVRLIPRAVLYRVSGLDAVEVVLDNGKCYHIGTDEPDALVDALRLRLGEPRPLSPEEAAARKPPATVFWVALAIILVILLAVAGLLFMETRPPGPKSPVASSVGAALCIDQKSAPSRLFF
ncbi:MAG: hypothetical protein D6790_21210 [Caldilineae bacterium]|nr:MAG: hypothetical protein D6790_21210 [Caldilineae bacterium]